MKWDCFYEGLNPQYQWKLAYKVDGKHPTSYSDLLLAKTGQSQNCPAPKDHHNWRIECYLATSIGNLYPSRKLKGSCTFTACSAILKSIGAEEDLSVKPEGEEVAESSDEKDSETSTVIGGADQLVRYIVCFANVVDLYQRKN